MGPKLEEFEVIDTIGRGSHGTVKKVRRKTDGQIIVWKELYYASMNEAEKKGLVLEVNLLRELHHPHIVKFFNHLVDRQTGTLFIFMEYCSGGDLCHLIKKCCKTSSFLEEGFIWKVLKQVCEALRACHEKQFDGGMIILHRDIKPANVFLDKDGNIKVGDFGLARTLNSASSFAKTFVGTPYYMSPEVIDGREYNERSDIWSLGCLIYELCALKPPFKASNQTELKEKIKAGKYKRIPIHYSNELWEVIQEMLNPDEFLRPSAFMLLHHFALEANISPKQEAVDDDLSESIALLFDETKRKMSENARCSDSATPSQSQSLADLTDGGESSYANPFQTTIIGKPLPEELKRMEVSLMREVESLLMESKIRREREHQERLKGNPLDISLLVSPTDQDVSSPCKEATVLSSHGDDSDSPKMISLRHKAPPPPKCVCGATSLNEWKKRLSVVRATEESIRQREMALEERERELTKRERRVHSMEQEAKQHFVRAQIYLKQIKCKGQQNTPLPHKAGRDHHVSDFDETTVSADLGYDETPTVAFLDIQSQNNPFLKMRQNLSKKSHTVHINTNLSRSNTLDNPKSRRKHGIYYYLEKSNPDKFHEPDQAKRKSYINYLSNDKNHFDGSNIKNNQTDGRVNSFDQDRLQKLDKVNVKPCSKVITENIHKTGKCKSTLKENTGTILGTLRQNFMRNNGSRKSAKSCQGDKENQVGVNRKHIAKEEEKKFERHPLRVINGKKYQSKGVCAISEKKLCERNANQRPFVCCNPPPPPSRQNTNHREPFFRFYNAI